MKKSSRAGHPLLRIKNKYNSGVSADHYLIPHKDNLIRLTKGMPRADVIAALGQPYRKEQCNSLSNEKLIFSMCSPQGTHVLYTALFTNETLVYIIKLS